MAQIQVGENAKSMFRKAQLQAISKLDTDADSYNQDCNAIAALLALKEAGADFSGCEAGEVLQILKIAGNASANRQALQAKASPRAQQITAELLKLV